MGKPLNAVLWDISLRNVILDALVQAVGIVHINRADKVRRRHDREPYRQIYGTAYKAGKKKLFARSNLCLDLVKISQRTFEFIGKIFQFEHGLYAGNKLPLIDWLT